MPVARVYLPATPADLDALARSGVLSGPRDGFGVGPGGSEDAEHAAWVRAAEAAGGMAGAGEPPRRRIIVSADVDVALVEPPPGPAASAVSVAAPIPVRRIVTFHVDEAVGSSIADLLWYDVTELDAVRHLLAGP